MGQIYLVRHGQASFGSANYDQLSELGHEQARRTRNFTASSPVT
jgi:broad specificity phosphatase PhoE